jgi:mono/diheme cytochrome c family protein
LTALLWTLWVCPAKFTIPSKHKFTLGDLQMRKNAITLFILCAAIMSSVLSGCNAGQGSSTSTQSVTGVAATGAPIVGAVSVQDSSIPAQVRMAMTADNGSFSVDVSGMVPPYLLKVEWTDNAGHNRMYSFVEQAGTANINPFSNVVFAAAVGISDQVALAADLDPTMYRSAGSRHRAIADSLKTALAPLFELFQTTINPVTDRFDADHTGLDALFDNVKIFVNNGMIFVANKNPYGLIFKGPIDNIASGTFYPQNMPIIASPEGSAAIDGAALYASKCGSCHGALATSSKRGRTAAQIQAAIGNINAMNSLSSLAPAQVQAIAAALGSTSPSTPPSSTPSDGAVLYASWCGSCHGSLATSSKRGRTASQIQSAISSVSQMRSLSSLTATQVQSIATALGTTSTTPPATDGATLYASYCSGCHGALASSTKGGRTAAQIQAAIGSQSAMSSLSSLTATQVQAVADALAATTPAPLVCGSCHAIPPATGQHSTHAGQHVACGTCHGSGYSSTTVNSTTHNNGVKNIASGSTPGWNPTTRSCSNSCHGTHYWGAATATPTPAPTTTPGTLDGAALYTQYCSGCHGPLATSGHRGATVAQIQTGINTISGMMSLSTLTTAELQAISDALNSTTTTTTPTTPAPLVCGSCHAIPPATGHHSTHNQQRVACGTCHGSGYSSTTVNATTHNNGVKNIASGSTPGWNPTTRSCSNSCHGTHYW